jgi:hypothetical protein
VLAAINGKEEPLIKISEVREVLSIMEAAFESSETNQSSGSGSSYRTPAGCGAN